MYMRFAHRDDQAWELGDYSYDLGDTLEIGVAKAAQYGIKPCSDGYAAFMTAFGRRVRIKEVSPKKRAANVVDMPPPGDANPSMQDMVRAA